MKTGQDYIESVDATKSEVYAFGEKAESLTDHPCFCPTINAVAPDI